MVYFTAYIKILHIQFYCIQAFRFLNDKILGGGRQETTRRQINYLLRIHITAVRGTGMRFADNIG